MLPRLGAVVSRVLLHLSFLFKLEISLPVLQLLVGLTEEVKESKKSISVTAYIKVTSTTASKHKVSIFRR